jgi:hypothetical protein
MMESTGSEFDETYYYISESEFKYGKHTIVQTVIKHRGLDGVTHIDREVLIDGWEKFSRQDDPTGALMADTFRYLYAIRDVQSFATSCL